jgi:hypothetical protein
MTMHDCTILIHHDKKFPEYWDIIEHPVSSARIQLSGCGHECQAVSYGMYALLTCATTSVQDKASSADALRLKHKA